MQLLTDDPVVRGSGPRRARRSRGALKMPGWLRRLPVLAGRTALWTLVALLLVTSGLSLVAHLRQVGQPPTAALAPTSLTPTAAEGFAVRFAYDYLTYDADAPDERAERLANYLAGGGDDQLGWDGIGEQSVLTVVSLGVQLLDENRAAVTVAALVDDHRWLQLAVRIHTDAAGRLAVSAPPSFVPFAPPAAPLEDTTPTDAALSGSIQPVLESFFRAYGEGRQEDLAYFVPVDQQIQGLGGQVSFEEITAVRVGEGYADRSAEVSVRWRDRATGAALVQQYQLGLTEDEGRWYVTRLGPTGATDSGGVQ